MKTATILILSLACALAAACSSDDPPLPATAAAPPQKTVFDTQLKALDKAKAVQGMVDKQKADTDKQLQDQGG